VRPNIVRFNPHAMSRMRIRTGTTKTCTNVVPASVFTAINDRVLCSASERGNWAM